MKYERFYERFFVILVPACNERSMVFACSFCIWEERMIDY